MIRSHRKGISVKITLIILTGVFVANCSYAQTDQWQPADNLLMTRWADDVNPDNPLPEYPRPQMEREKWNYDLRPGRDQV